jgi:hypothetical protein
VREKSQPKLKITESNKLGKPQIRSNSIKPLKKANTLIPLPHSRKEDENIYSLVNKEERGCVIPKPKLYVHEDNELDDDINLRLNTKSNRFNDVGPTPKHDEINSLKPKINRNYIKENRLTTEAPSKIIKKDDELKGFDVNRNHRSYGKTPE